MSTTSQDQAFRERVRKILGPHRLDGLSDVVLAELGDAVTGTAYFRNPHVVFSMMVDTPGEQLETSLTTFWESHRKRNFRSSVRPEHGEERGSPGGVYEGGSEHVEAYVDFVAGRTPYALHRSGRSFRIRASRRSASTGDARILLVLSYSPFWWKGCDSELYDAWPDFSTDDQPDFGRLAEHKDRLVAESAMPSVVDCFVVYAKDWAGAEGVVRRLADLLPLPDMQVVLRSQKTSVRTVFKPWNQNPTSGVMQPAWAYGVLDRIKTDLSPPLKEMMLARGNAPSYWDELTQVEIESGPDPELYRWTAEIVGGTRRHLDSQRAHPRQVLGRKYHRILWDAGIHASLKSALYCFVSCDIEGHGTQRDVAVQERNIRAINDIVREHLHSNPDSIWASGGDGGHIAIPAHHGMGKAIELIASLRDWAPADAVDDESASDSQSCRLRIASHVGTAINVEGADGRTQLVGRGINISAALLDFGSAEAVVVSDEFKHNAELECVPGLDFTSDRTVYVKHFSAERLYLLNVSDRFASSWGTPAKSERSLLNEANARASRADQQERDLAWRIIYHAKRLLQCHTEDLEARRVLAEVAGRHFNTAAERDVQSLDPKEREAFQFINLMNADSFTELLQRSELVERKDGEHLCFKGEAADTMFIVLMGQVGVVVESNNLTDELRASPHRIRFLPGHIVGELGFVLRSNRTASLQAIGRVAVLAINYRRLDDVFARAGDTAEARRESARQKVLGVFRPKVLQYVCNHADYLVGPIKNGPLQGVESPWGYMKEEERSDVYYFDNSKDALLSMADPRFRDRDGVFILVSGRLKAVSSEPDEQSHAGSDPAADVALRVLWVRLPDYLEHVTPRFRCVGSHAVILRVGAAAFNAIADMYSSFTLANLAQALKRELAKYEHVARRVPSEIDAGNVAPAQAVFISYKHGGESQRLAERIESILQSDGVEVVRDVRAIGYKGDIETFMDRLSDGRSVVCVLNDAYLRSHYCVRELMTIMKHEDGGARIFPIFLPDLAIQDPASRLEYVKYWQKVHSDLNEEISKLPAHERLETTHAEIRLVAEIADEIDGLTGWLKRTNALVLAEHERTEFKALRAALAARRLVAPK